MGIASVGVCLIDIRNHEIILMASHIFKAPVEGKQKDISARIFFRLSGLKHKSLYLAHIL